MKRILIIFALILISACSQDDRSEHLLEIDQNSGSINFSRIVTGNWERVCFFGPYSNNAMAKSTLGFEWDLEKHSRIYSNDGITLAVFTNSSHVVTYKEIPRYADFSKFSRKCFSKANTRFNVKPGNITHTEADA